MALQKVLCVLLVLLYIVLSGSATTLCYVRSTTSATCPAEPCLTLSDYVSNTTEYFTSDTSFIFLEGEHYLNSSLVLNNIANITLSGIDMRVRIIISAEASVSCTNSLAITLNSLEIVYYGKTEELSRSALLFDNSQSVQISDVSFTGHSRALSYTQTTSHITNCSFSNGHSDYGGAINMYFSNITFSSVNSYTNNTADISGGAVFANNSMLVFSGVNLFLRNKAGTVNTSGNYTIGGGAIFSSQSVIELSGFNNFTRNGPIDASQYILLGGALMIRYNSNLKIQGSAIFHDNSGYSGAAIFTINSKLSFSGEINFVNNSAPFSRGGAIFAVSSTMHYQGDIHFAINAADNGGAIYLERSDLTCQGSVTFSNNLASFDGGGVYAKDSTVRVSGNVSYMENIARSGGGMGFRGSSQLVLQSPVMMTFYHNKAAETGGALLFFDSYDTFETQCQNIAVETKNCFFKVEAANPSILPMDVHLNFTQNSANVAGTALFGGALELCRVQVNNIQVDSNSLQFLQNISTFFPSLHEDQNSSITSSPQKVCFCNNGDADCSGANRKTFNTVQGRMFNLSIIAVGQLDMPVPSRIVAFISPTHDNSDGSIEHRPQNHTIDVKCNTVGFRLFTKYDSEYILIYPEGCVGVRLYVEVKLDPCPNGFNLTDKSCECEKRLRDLKIACDIDTGLIKRPGNSWIGPILDKNQTYLGFIRHPNCPNTYCKQENTSDPTWLNFSTTDNDNQCTDNRTKLLCGSCKHGYSLTLNNFQCRKCENKFISLILFFGIAGIALIAILLTLQMTVAAGTINGLILYANIVNVHRDIFFPPDKTNVNPLSIFIAWVNLDFGIPTCFYDGLDAYSYAWLEYAFPLYLWFLIGIIIFTSKLSMKLGKLFGSNPVAVLATVVLMSYTKLLQTTVGVLLFTYLEYTDEKRKSVWLFDANVTYFEGKHIILAIVAICVIIFLLLPYIFLLTFGYQLQAYSGKKYFFWFNKFKPILDAYYAPYNKKTRYWTGFMLFVRGCLYLGFIMSSSTTNLVAVSSLFMAIAAIPWLSNRIYEKLYIDILEASFILNIGILSSITYHVQTVHGNQAVVTYLSVGIAFVEFIGIVIFHLYIRIKNIKCIKHVKGTVMELKTKKSSNEILNDEAASTTTTYVDIRELLLEDNKI